MGAAATEFSDIYAHEAFTVLPSAAIGDAVVLYLPLMLTTLLVLVFEIFHWFHTRLYGLYGLYC